MLRFRAVACTLLVACGISGAAALGATGCGSFSGEAAPGGDEAGAETGTSPEASATDASEAGDAASMSEGGGLAVVWARSYGPGADADGGHVYVGTIAVAPSGESRTIGTYQLAPMDVGAVKLPPADGEDAFVIDLAATGDVANVNAVGTPGNELGTAIASTSMHTFEGFIFSDKLQLGATELAGEGIFNADVARFAPALSGEYPILGSGNIQLRALASSGSDAVSAFGTFTDNVRVVAVPSSTFVRDTPGTPALFVARLFATPDRAAALCDQGTTACSAEGLATNDTGQAGITGGFTGDLALGDAGSFSSTQHDAYVSVLDTSLDVVWASRLGGTGNEEGHAIAAIPGTSDFIVAGTFDGTLDAGATKPHVTTRGGLDLFVARFDATGTITWLQTFGGADDDFVRAVTVDAAGRVYMAGQFASPSIDFGGGALMNAGLDAGLSGTDIYVVVLDAANGNHVQSARFGGASDEGVAGIGLDGLGHLLVAGALSGPVDFGGVPLTTTGSAVFVAKLTTR